MMITSHFVNLAGLSANTTYFYRVKSRDAAGNLATSAEFTFSTGSGQSTAQNVVWTSAVGVTVTGNSLTQNSCDGCQVGAVSAQTIVSGDGYVEFTAQETSTFRGAGLSNGNTDGSFSDIDFAVQLYPNGVAAVRENGVYKADVLHEWAVFQVAVEGGQVKYRKDGALFYTSAKAPIYPLLMHASLATTASTVNNAVIAGQLSGP